MQIFICSACSTWTFKRDPVTGSAVEPHFPHALSCPRNSPMGENHINDGKWYHFSRGGYNGPRFNLRPSAAPREKTAPNICHRDNCKPMGGIFVHAEQVKHVKIFI